MAVVEAGQVYFVRTDHIGRPVFATDTLGTKVWEASYLPFGGVQTSTGANAELRFPGQWFQSETALHQNWMRDYDPTTGRYIQADPLGLIDGASVYGYALQNPGRYIDPRGEFGVVGALIGGGANLGIQFAKNLYLYGNGITALKCIDIKAVAASAAFGALGVSPLKALRSNGVRNAAQIFGITYFAKLEAGFQPITVGDDCECAKPEGRIPDWLDNVLTNWQI